MEYHENVLQSYRQKQFNTQLQEYTEVPGEAIWWHRMQEKLSALGELTVLPRLVGGRWLPLLHLPPALGPLDLASPVPPLQVFAPQCPHLMQAGDAQTCVFL